MRQQGTNQERSDDMNSTSGTAGQAKNSLPASKSFSIPASGPCPGIFRRKLILPELADDCLLSIAEFLKSERDINALAQTNHRLYDLLNYHLYRHNVQFGSSALLWAASRGKNAAVKKLLVERANVQAVDGHGRTPLLLAATNGHEAVAKLLLATEGVNPEFKDPDGRTPLLLAAMNGHEAVVKLLLATEGVDPESKDSDGRTPLLLAVKNRFKVVAKLLLATEDVNPESKDSDSWTPLPLATTNGHEAVAKLLLATEGVNPEPKDSDGRKPVLLAVKNRCKTVVKLLLSMESVNPESKDSDGRTPLLLTVKNRCKAVVKLLLATESVNPESRGFKGRAPLLLTVQECPPESIPNSRTNYEFGKTLLTSAIENGSEETCQILLAEGAEVGYHYIPLYIPRVCRPHRNEVSESDLTLSRSMYGIYR